MEELRYLNQDVPFQEELSSLCSEATELLHDKDHREIVAHLLEHHTQRVNEFLTTHSGVGVGLEELHWVPNNLKQISLAINQFFVDEVADRLEGEDWLGLDFDGKEVEIPPLPEQLDSPPEQLDAEMNRVKLKEAAPRVAYPGNATKSSIQKESKKARSTPTPSSIASPGPVVNQLSDSVRESFETGRPMEDSPDLQICTSCKRSFLANALSEHTKKCNGSNASTTSTDKKLKVKKNKALEKETKAKSMEKAAISASVVDEDEDAAGEEDDGDGEADGGDSKGMVGMKKGAKKSAGKAASAAGVSKGKKRKAEGESEKAPKTKKKKEEAKPKVAKPKGPVDVERQCGVITPSGLPCARSLTCKSHSMGLKRSVPGRSRPYDTLLSAYQKKNQAKQQKAALDATAPLHDSDEDTGPIDSDEETAAILTATKNFHPSPYIPLPPPSDSKPIKDYVRSLRIQQQLQETLSAEGNIFAVKRWGFVAIPGHPGFEGEVEEGVREAYKGPGSVGFVGPMPTDGVGQVSRIEPVGMDFSAVEEACVRVEREGVLGRGLWD